MKLIEISFLRPLVASSGHSWVKQGRARSPHVSSQAWHSNASPARRTAPVRSLSLSLVCVCVCSGARDVAREGLASRVPQVRALQEGAHRRPARGGVLSPLLSALRAAFFSNL